MTTPPTTEHATELTDTTFDAHLDVHTAVVSPNPIVRWAWGTGGTAALGMGLIGVVVPGWPTTIFLIIAAACYARSSQRMYNWIIRNRLFGRHVKNFRETGVMPIRAKVFALGIMWPFVLASVFFFIPDSVMWAKLLTLAIALIGTTYILWLPSRVPTTSTDAIDAATA